MRQLAVPFTLILSLALTLQAAPNAMNDLYSEFQLTRIQLKSTVFTAQNFVTRFQSIDQQLQKKYTAYKSLEKEELTSKGNQMSYDLELLEPLRSLASQGINTDNCQQSSHNNEINFNVDDKSDNELIQRIIKSVCK